MPQAAFETDHSRLIEALSRPARLAPESGIVEVMNYGRQRGDVMPLWAGEGDLPTPAFISDAAARALADGETFYTWQRGIPELREALARYHERLYPRAFWPTSSTSPALACRRPRSHWRWCSPTATSSSFPRRPGRTRRPQPASPVRAIEVPMALGNAGWTLDYQRLADAVTPRTRALFIVSRSNPTGWTAARDDLRATLSLACRHGLWIIADETYARFWYGEGARAPSFLDVMDPEDRILFVNTFSKNWAMTGWRMGWIMAHPALGQVIENLIQYSTSGVAQFMQRAGIAALEQGEAFVAQQIARAKAGRDIVASALAATGRCRFALPDGAFYLLF